ncbi:6799_t:CDS:2 [Gigaspora margarita]|uniref:6799_t:CDS:1 n=1 Tax=Gigaspora margarita TaxID=4874 RepID=A0ABM8W3Z9_GIGMA|nr:6799_t:CDS:2 [Gigaspora margarita]
MLLKIAKGIPKRKKAITKSSGCKIASICVQETEQGSCKTGQKEEFRLLKLGTHNINSLKLNKQKLEDLAEYKKEEKIDIIGIDSIIEDMEETTDKNKNVTFNEKQLEDEVNKK